MSLGSFPSCEEKPCKATARHWFRDVWGEVVMNSYQTFYSQLKVYQSWFPIRFLEEKPKPRLSKVSRRLFDFAGLTDSIGGAAKWCQDTVSQVQLQGFYLIVTLALTFWGHNVDMFADSSPTRVLSQSCGFCEFNLLKTAGVKQGGGCPRSSISNSECAA